MKSVTHTVLTALLWINALSCSTALSQGQAPLQDVLPVSYNQTASLLALHKDLVSIESITGNEHEVGNYLVDYLRARGFSVKTQELPPYEASSKQASRFNVYAYNGESPKSTVLVTSHMDTVPPFYNYTIRPGNEIWGRGSVDAKGSVAAQITATLALLESKKIRHGDVALLFVVGEEVGGDGMKHASDLDLYWKAAIFGEPTELKLVAGHKGILGFSMRAKGKAAHSGYPWLGESANSKLIRAMAILDKMDLGSSEKYGNTTINIGRFEGGVAGNVVPERAMAQVAVRLAVGPHEEINEKIREAVGDEVEFEFRGGYDPIDCDIDVEGFETMTVNYGTDIPNLRRDRVGKRYLYGPGTIFVAHSDHEHLNVKDLEEATEGYKRLILHSLKSVN